MYKFSTNVGPVLIEHVENPLQQVGGRWWQGAIVKFPVARTSPVSDHQLISL